MWFKPVSECLAMFGKQAFFLANGKIQNHVNT